MCSSIRLLFGATDKRQQVAIGLDIGTSGARALAVDFGGRVVAEGRAKFTPNTTSTVGTRVEQDPHAWSLAACDALRQLTSGLASTHHVVGLAVDATSGTFLLVDGDNRPLTSGIMYNDQRAIEETDEVADVLNPVLQPYGIRIASSFALPKILNLRMHAPKIWQRCRRVVHQTDWIVGMLCGRYDVTDVSTALKTGVDPGHMTWPGEIERLEIPHDRLPDVVLPGTHIGTITAATVRATGLPADTPIIAGCTDGTAGCLASGAAAPGDLNVTLGTTLVFKAIAQRPVQDPDGVIYNHRHPGGGFLPGAASSTGAEWIEQEFGGQDLEQLGRLASRCTPTRHVVYPLAKIGERFPFACPTATGFGLRQIAGAAERFAAGLEAVAYLERMGTERLEQLGLHIGPSVYATGGATAGDVWLRIRATVNRRVYRIPRYPDCAVGAAVLAALPSLGGYREAARTIVQLGHVVEPESRMTDAYDEMFGRFKRELLRRGYVVETHDNF